VRHTVSTFGKETLLQIPSPETDITNRCMQVLGFLLILYDFCNAGVSSMHFRSGMEASVKIAADAAEVSNY
jgi:hypothetical protein